MINMQKQTPVAIYKLVACHMLARCYRLIVASEKS